jgi:hypothetical protein
MEESTNLETNVKPKEMLNSPEFKDDIKNALKHFLYYYFVYLLFLVPFALWSKATIRLSKQSKEGSLNIADIDSKWPFLSFLKRFLFEFLIDGAMFMSYILAPVLAIYIWGDTGDFIDFIGVIIVSYCAPLYFTILRDILQILILPFQKYIDWANKPAQHMDIKHSGDIRKS